jgi:hypothetical protein
MHCSVSINLTFQKEKTMKTRTMLLAVTLIMGCIMAVAGLAYSFTAGAHGKSQYLSASPTPTPKPAPKRVNLQCKNGGSQQDVAKDPDIINNTGKAIPVGTKLYWTASDGDKGTLVLETALAPNGKVRISGTPGQVYTCKAWYMK